MPLDAREFKRRSKEFFPASYLTSIGVIQSVAMGLLAFRILEANLTLQVAMQMIASFLAIFLIATEYMWWLLLIRRTPRHRDVAVPYVMGIFEFLAVGQVDNLESRWFFFMTFLTVVGVWALLVGREDCENPKQFTGSMWVQPLAIRNANKSIALVTAMGATSLLAGLDLHLKFFESRGVEFRAWMLCLPAFYVFCAVILYSSSNFLQDIKNKFGVE